MLKRFIFTALFLALLVCCDNTDDSLSKNNCQQDLDKNEIEVTSLAVSELLKNGFPKGVGVITVDETLVSHMQRNMSEILKVSNEKLWKLETAMVEDFESKNQNPRSFGTSLKLPYKYENMSGKEFVEVSKINPYMAKTDPLKKQFPNSAGLNGIVGFSRAGFNKDFSKTVIYVFRWYDHGSFFLVENENCEWRIKQEHMIWLH